MRLYPKVIRMVKVKRLVPVLCSLFLIMPTMALDRIPIVKADPLGGQDIVIGKLKIINGNPSIELYGDYYDREKNVILVPAHIEEASERFRFWVDWEIKEDSHYKEKWVFSIVLGGSYQHPCKVSDKVTIYDTWGKDDSCSTDEHPEKRMYIEDRPWDAENSWPETEIVLKAQYYRNDDPIFWSDKPTLRKEVKKSVTLHFCFYPPEPNKVSPEMEPAYVGKPIKIRVGGEFAPSLYINKYRIIIDYGDGTADCEDVYCDYKRSYWIEFSHTYSSPGKYKVKAKAVEYKLGLESDWKEITLEVKKKKSYNVSTIERESSSRGKKTEKTKIDFGGLNFLYTISKIHRLNRNITFISRLSLPGLSHLHPLRAERINQYIFKSYDQKKARGYCDREK